ncbi:hypothetical protein K1719_038196 [Acacia pycnantha]|nr:hypothetical protein K1719_038196 [Acacia pycnantha]
MTTSEEASEICVATAITTLTSQITCLTTAIEILTAPVDLAMLWLSSLTHNSYPYFQQSEDINLINHDNSPHQTESAQQDIQPRVDSILENQQSSHPITFLFKEHMERNDLIIPKQQETLRKLENRLGQLTATLADESPLVNKETPTIIGNKQEPLPQQSKMITNITVVTPSHMMATEASTFQENAMAEALQQIPAPGQPWSPGPHIQRFQGFLDVAQ